MGSVRTRDLTSPRVLLWRAIVRMRHASVLLLLTALADPGRWSIAVWILLRIAVQGLVHSANRLGCGARTPATSACSNVNETGRRRRSHQGDPRATHPHAGPRSLRDGMNIDTAVVTHAGDGVVDHPASIRPRCNPR
jgi:hypothetical protein